MSNNQANLKEQIKQAVRAHLEEVGHGWHAQAKLNESDTEYGDGYACGQNSCAEQLFEIIEELMGVIDSAPQDQTDQEDTNDFS